MPYDLVRSHIVKVPILSTIHANEAIARSLSTETALSSAGTSTVPTAAQKDRLLKLRFRRKTAMLLQPPFKQQRPRGAWSGVGGRAAAARGNRRMLQSSWQMTRVFLMSTARSDQLQQCIWATAGHFINRRLLAAAAGDVVDVVDC